jgi:hypothetical protein
MSSGVWRSGRQTGAQRRTLPVKLRHWTRVVALMRATGKRIRPDLPKPPGRHPNRAQALHNRPHLVAADCHSKHQANPQKQNEKHVNLVGGRCQLHSPIDITLRCHQSGHTIMSLPRSGGSASDFHYSN